MINTLLCVALRGYRRFNLTGRHFAIALCLLCRPRGTRARVTAVGIDTQRNSAASAPRERSLASYLLLPRPKDVAKGWLVVTTCTLGALSAGEVDGVLLLRALVAVTVLELLVYQARYQWNDVRGFVADQSHPSSSSRGRLPGPVTRARSHVLASCAVGAIRLALAGVVILALPRLHLGGILGLGAAGVFGVAIAYELLRSAITGRSGAAHVPTPSVLLLWLAVGSGYAVRGLVGLAVAVDPWQRPELFVAAVVALWGYGVTFVTCRWAVEATSFAAVRDGRVAWNARPDQAREHQLALIRWLPFRVSAGVSSVTEWAPLRERTAWTAPWNLAAVVAGGGAAVSGRLLVGPCPFADLVSVAAAGAAATLVALSISRRRALVIILAALLLLGSFSVTATPRPLLAGLPWLLMICAYHFFTTRTLANLSRTRPGARLAQKAIGTIARVVVGKTTWQAMQRPGGCGEEA
jgi:4-hydroxybenzoate polyprenyltransferase